jgi:hypothetical protein
LHPGGKLPADTDIADVGSCGAGDVIQKISHRVIRKLRHLGYLEAGLDAAMATGDAPLVDDEPERARTLAASVQQRIALHTNTQVPAHQRDQWERRRRYTARGVVSLERW